MMLTITTALAFAVLVGTDLGPEQRKQLEVIDVRIDTIEALYERGRISEAVRNDEVAGQLARASTIAGQPLDRVGLHTAIAPATASGLWDFIDLVWVIVAGLLFTSVLWLGAVYVIPLIRRLPTSVIELGCYLAAAALVVVPLYTLEGGGRTALALVGCLGLTATIAHTFARWTKHRRGGSLRTLTGTIAIVWLVAAVAHRSPLIGYVATLAVMWTFGVFILPTIGLVDLHRRYVPAAMISAAMLVVTFGGLLHAPIGTFAEVILEVFGLGARVNGALVFFGACLILASRHYSRHWPTYVTAQVIALGAAAAMLLFGSIYEIDVVREAGGTFCALYAVEKLFDIPWSRHGWAWMLLLLAGLLWVGATFVETYPQYFIGFD